MSLALDGDTGMAVGSSERETGGLLNSGALYMFSRSSDGSHQEEDWTLDGVLSSDDAAAQDRFGSSVAVQGAIMVVGAQQNAQGNGKVYVYSKSGGAWVQSTDVLTASDGAPGDSFGSAVSLDSGGTLAIGAPGRSNEQGAVYMFAQSSAGSTAFTEVATLEPSDGKSYDYFGASLSVSGAMLMVGAVGAGPGQAGLVYQFSYSGGAWAEMLTLSDAGARGQ